ncbi:hypothetical protein Droror1_Dr00027295 [Drosera rotundifolia]
MNPATIRPPTTPPDTCDVSPVTHESGYGLDRAHNPPPQNTIAPSHPAMNPAAKALVGPLTGRRRTPTARPWPGLGPDSGGATGPTLCLVILIVSPRVLFRITHQGGYDGWELYDGLQGGCVVMSMGICVLVFG